MKEVSVEDKKRRRFILLLLFLPIVGLIWSHYSGNSTAPNSDVAKLEYDENAQRVIPSPGVHDVVKDLNEKVADGMIRISINPSPEFDSETLEGEATIINHIDNKYPQIVEIVLDETGESLYKSKAIPVGQGIEKITLNKTLEKGTYECTAYFTALNPEIVSSVGTAGAKLKIHIL